MNESLLFLQKHRGRGALLDANLLLIYVVGKVHRSRLSQFRHTEQYANDFPLIERLVKFFPRIFTTPNVLTEVSNLGRKLGPEFLPVLRKVVSILDERYCVSAEAVAVPHFQNIGLTDAGLYTIASEHLIITMDFDLYHILRQANVEAVNFHHLRLLDWSVQN